MSYPTRTYAVPSHAILTQSPSPTIPVAAKTLAPTQRQQLALDALAGTQPIRQLADTHHGSRKFVARQAHKRVQARSSTKPSPRCRHAATNASSSTCPSPRPGCDNSPWDWFSFATAPYAASTSCSAMSLTIPSPSALSTTWSLEPSPRPADTTTTTTSPASASGALDEDFPGRAVARPGRLRRR